MSIIRNLWRAQPQEVELNRGHWISTPELYGAFAFGSNGSVSRNLAAKQGLTVNGNVAASGSANGAAALFSSGSYVYSKNLLVAPPGNGSALNFTILIGVTPRDTSDCGIYGYSTSAANLASGSSLLTPSLRAMSGNYVLFGGTPSGAVEPGKLQILCIRYKDVNGYVSVTVDGKSEISSTGSWSTIGNAGDTERGIGNVYPSAYTGNMHFVLEMQRYISDAQLNDFVRRPFAWIAPRRIYIPAPAAGGGIPTLSNSTYVTGSLTSTGWRPQVTAT